MVTEVSISGGVSITANFDGNSIDVSVSIASPIIISVQLGYGIDPTSIPHNLLTGRDAVDVHPISSITGLSEAIAIGISANGKAETAQSSADAAMAQAEAATDMAATNTLSISNILANFTAWVLNSYLGALTLLDAAIAAGDSLQAIAGKLQGQLNAVKVRLGLLENRVITELTLTQDVEFVEFQLNGETDFEIQYSSMTGARSNSVNGYMTVNDISTQNYVSGTTRYSGMLIYIGRYSFSGKIEVRLINNIVSFFNVVQQIWGLSSTPETKNITSRMQSGYLETPVSVITNIRITYPFNSGATFKLVRK